MPPKGLMAFCAASCCLEEEKAAPTQASAVGKGCVLPPALFSLAARLPGGAVWTRAISSGKTINISVSADREAWKEMDE